MANALDGKVDRTAFSVRRLTDPDDALAYWLTKTPQERLRAAEELRQLAYGYTDASEGLQRVPTVVEFERR